jgi:hypothetical protein
MAYKKNPSTQTTLLILGGVLAAGGLAYYLYSKSKTSSSAKAVPAAPAVVPQVAPAAQKIERVAVPFNSACGVLGREIIRLNDESLGTGGSECRFRTNTPEATAARNECMQRAKTQLQAMLSNWRTDCGTKYLLGTYGGNIPFDL